MGWSRVSWVSVSLLAIVGCGGATNVATQPPAAEPSPGVRRTTNAPRTAEDPSDAPQSSASEADVEPIAEGLFAAAEEKRQTAAHLMMPPYKGDGSYASVDAYLQNDLAPWMKQKRALVDEAEASYAKIEALKPAPPARWVVDASAKVAYLWGEYAAQYRTPALPTKWVDVKTGDRYQSLRASFYRDVDRAAEPITARAAAAFQKCHDDSVRLDYVDDLTKSCERWLERAHSASGDSGKDDGE
jgi:hypothetical protein